MNLHYMISLLLTATFLATGCTSGDGGTSMKQPEDKVSHASPVKYSYSVYIENSGSLNGYLHAVEKGNFREEIGALIADISSLQDKPSINLYDVNTKVIPVALHADAEALGHYLDHLDEKVFKARSAVKGGDQSQSNLSNIIKNIIDSTRNNEVSLLVSDCIFSPGKGQPALRFLGDQQNDVQLYIGERLRTQALSTLVLQFVSDFTGTYFDQNNAERKGHFPQRPYYVVCFGKEEALQQLRHLASDTSRFSGFRNFMFLTTTKSYDVAPRIRANDQYYDYDLDRPLVVEDIRKGGSDQKFRIIFDADFSRLPVDEGYLRSPANYTISNGYTIDSIVASGKKGLTHKVVLLSVKPQAGTVQIALKKQLPYWVNTSNLDADAGLPADSLAGKTFGIRYLLDGMSRAYDRYTHTSSYYNFSITIKNN